MSTQCNISAVIGFQTVDLCLQ